ncbi:MAG: KH domain-containing protein [Candidatus Aenigmatarchaeota archaeon]
MKTSICDVCLKNEMLCEGCSKKLEDGEISEEAVTISRLLYRLRENYPYLEDAEIKRIFSAEELVIIIAAEGDVGKVVGKGGEVVKRIADELDNPVRVVEYSSDIKDFVRNLLPNIKVYGINEVFSPDGKYYRIVISEEHKNRLVLSEEEVSSLVEDVSGEKIKLSLSP